MSTKSLQEKKRNLADQIWLSYFNQILYEKGLITERERNQMILKIDKWKPAST